MNTLKDKVADMEAVIVDMRGLPGIAGPKGDTGPRGRHTHQADIEILLSAISESLN